MKCLTYPGLLLLRELGMTGMLRLQLLVALAGFVTMGLFPQLPSTPLWALLAYLAIASLWSLAQELQ